MSLWLKFVWLWSEIISEYDIYQWQETFFCHHLKCFFLYVGPHLKRLLPVFTDNRLIYMSLENEVIGIIIHETDFRMQYCCQLLEKIWWQKKNASAISMIISSVQFSCSVVSNFLQPHGLQHSRLPCPSPIPGACSFSCPLSPWCHPTISSFVIPFSSCLQSFPASESFPMSQFFASGGQSIGVSALTSVLPMNIQDWFPWELMVWSLRSPRDS